MKLPTVLITGASTGIGAAYAERLAQRGHDLVLVARNQARLQTLAAELRTKTGVAIDVLPADLTDRAQLAAVEARLREDDRIGILINNAGSVTPHGLDKPDPDGDERLISLNITAVTRLTDAVIPRLLKAGQGAIVNVASVLALAPEVLPGIYAATKAYVLSFSQALQKEVGPKGIYVQAVLPSATRTEIWGHAGRSVEEVPGMMDTLDMVDASLSGFDQRELVTFPSVHDLTTWQTLESTRQALIPQFFQATPAPRYQTALAK